MDSKELVALAESLRGKYVTLEVMGGRAGEAVYLHNHRINGVRDNGIMSSLGSYRVEADQVVRALFALAQEPRHDAD